MTVNEDWARRIIRRLDPHFRQRWEAYDDLLTTHLTEKSKWLDIGCGRNEAVFRFGNRGRLAIGLDIQIAENRHPVPFLQADMQHLPFRSDSFDLITLRFVVEHLPDTETGFADIERVLKQNGKVIVITTNVWSPFVAFARLLPYRLKQKMLRSLYKVEEEDILPTYYRFNSASQMRRGVKGLRLIELDYVQGATYDRRYLFLLFFFWHLISKRGPLKPFRDNLLSVFEKK
ncbi:MAG: class I SAM-dependent methyltransferase [Candidatus Marinimicrobia bacterium]|jgi:ubiquinone/menaquinone biosynthesis C-methylase UbiE|nr:class I SAM-dependent methyltransferase [Candidatus Neomarinimicrobiota bacterium]